MRINVDECLSCGMCLEACPMDAIKIHQTAGYARFEIDTDMCIECEECVKVCPGECIS